MYVRNCCKGHRCYCLGTLLFIMIILSLLNLYPPYNYFLREAFQYFTEAPKQGMNKVMR
jgi:hypothetical protein